MVRFAREPDAVVCAWRPRVDPSKVNTVVIVREKNLLKCVTPAGNKIKIQGGIDTDREGRDGREFLGFQVTAVD